MSVADAAGPVGTGGVLVGLAIAGGCGGNQAWLCVSAILILGGLVLLWMNH